MVGHRRWRSSRGGAVDPCGSAQSVGLAGGVPEATVDGGRLTEEEAVGSGAFARDVAIGLGSPSASTEEDVEVEASAALEGHGRAWWRSMIVKQAIDRRAESMNKERGRGGKKEVGELSLCAHTRDNVAHPRGVAVTGGDWRRWPLCYEGSHRMVSGSMAGGTGLGTRLPD
jgi:hypothetical protein